MATGQSGNRMGNQGSGGHQTAGTNDPDIIDEADLSREIMGRNALQGRNQRQVHNQRESMPGETDRTEGVVESFERMDPKVRAGKA